MSEFFSISCGSRTVILNKHCILSVDIFTSSFNSRQIEISMTEGVNHNLNYGVSLQESFEASVKTIQDNLLNQ